MKQRYQMPALVRYGTMQSITRGASGSHAPPDQGPQDAPPIDDPIADGNDSPPDTPTDGFDDFSDHPADGTDGAP